MPQPGSYVSESNYFNANWKQAFWGGNYARLRAVKDRYDPLGRRVAKQERRARGLAGDPRRRGTNNQALPAARNGSRDEDSQAHQPPHDLAHAEGLITQCFARISPD